MADTTAGPAALTIIGHVSSPFRSPGSTPIQAQRGRPATGRVWIEPDFCSGLAGLEGFDFAVLLTHLDRVPAAEAPWTVEPFLLGGTGAELGVFATRHPRRPNPIGLTLVRVTAVHDDGFDFEGVDLLDGTPLLDVKPYVPAFDVPRHPPSRVRAGWFDTPGVLDAEGTTPATLREERGDP